MELTPSHSPPSRYQGVQSRKPLAVSNQLSSRLKIDESEIRSRRAFFELKDEDLSRLAALKSLAEQNTEAITESLYELLLNHPETHAFFPDEQTIRHVKKMQNAYFLLLFSGKCDSAYVENRLRVGAVHEQIGMPPKWYLGAYRRYLGLIYDLMVSQIQPVEEARKAYHSVKKLIFFDMSLAIDTYIASHVDTVNRHRAAIRELSTPVIRIYDQVLLLPLIGTVDTQRAQQVMETVLTRITEERAKIVILDIAGVPVVDTKVADNLIQTTGAARLLGAQVILTGITAQVAQTVIQLGVDISEMHTLSRLSDGIELAFRILGKKVVSSRPKPAQRRGHA